MQKSTRRLAFVVGGTLITSIGLFIGACSTDNGTTTPLPGSSSGTSGGKKDGSSGSTGSTGTSGTSGTSGGEDDGGSSSGADCGNAPILRGNGNGGFFCAFFRRDAGGPVVDAGGTANCANNETCCNPASAAGGAFPPSFCARTESNQKGVENNPACAAQATAMGSQWPAGGAMNYPKIWECGDKNACAGGQVCCMYSEPNLPATDKVNIGPNTDPQVPPACNAKQAYKYGGSKCAAACDADEIQLCSSTDMNCTGGKTCLPFEVRPGGKDLASCR
jgi:hypothetical protein